MFLWEVLPILHRSLQKKSAKIAILRRNRRLIRPSVPFSQLQKTTTIFFFDRYASKWDIVKHHDAEGILEVFINYIIGII